MGSCRSGKSATTSLLMSEDDTLKVIRNVYFIGINIYACGVVDNGKKFLIQLQSGSLYSCTRNYPWGRYTFTYSPLGFG